MRQVKAYGILAEIYDGYWGKFSTRYIPFLNNLLDRYAYVPKTILDLACGTGVLIAKLSEKALRVVGLDISPEMIMMARQNCEHRSNIELVEGDFRSFNLKEKFDLILCCFDSVNYVYHPSEIKNLFNCVRQHLNVTGFFVFDVVNEKHFQRLAGSSGHYKVNRILYEHSCTYDCNSRVAETVFLFESGIEGHRQVPIEYDEILDTIEKTGLSMVEVFADLNRNPIQETTERYFFVVKRGDRE